MRKMLGIFTAITAALVVVGAAWAAGDARQAPTVLAPLALSGSSPSSADPSSSSSSSSASSSSSSSSTTPSTVPSATSPSTSTPGSSSSTSTPGASTSTSTSNSTSTTVEEEFTTSSGGTFKVADGVTVTVDLQGGALVLVDVSAPGWAVEIKDRESDRIRIRFEKSGARAEFEAELDDGRLEVEIERS